MPHVTLQVFIIILYENVFQNPELFRTQVSLSPEQSTLGHQLQIYSNRDVYIAVLHSVKAKETKKRHLKLQHK
jgi:hypothetical protein